MSAYNRLILISLIAVAIAFGLRAQEAPAEPATPATAEQTSEDEIQQDDSEEDGYVAATQSSYEVRSEFSQLLRQSPPELSTILSLDPTLLSNQAFLEGYPHLAAFVAANPEVQRNPRFFLQEFQPVRHEHSFVQEILEVAVIFSSFLLATLALAWLVRTVIEQKRWNRLSKTQSEVHNKILDRFENNEELLAYIRTPAGSRFLESAPIPLHDDRPSRRQNPSFSRVLLSIQIGVVVALGSLGMLLVSGQFKEDAALELFAFGMIALCIGVGFIASGAVSLVLSKRLGLWEGPDVPATGRELDQSGIVR